MQWLSAWLGPGLVPRVNVFTSLVQFLKLYNGNNRTCFLG